MTMKLSASLLFVLVGVASSTFQHSRKKRADCGCFNPLSGSSQAFVGETDFTCTFNKWCFVPCDSGCSDMEPLTGFFGGKCKSVSACDPDITPTEPPPSTPATPTEEAPMGPCECLDPTAVSCDIHQKCIVACGSVCSDEFKGKRGKCVSTIACTYI
eukprot:GFUD01019139.1.p1 GENE.GFUD01019139.1~~GFUD01019139.1.p1  ORF type:complete len:157 (+),score=9.58 GFUD01019139.1:317-787(+)